MSNKVVKAYGDNLKPDGWLILGVSTTLHYVPFGKLACCSLCGNLHDLQMMDDLLPAMQLCCELGELKPVEAWTDET